MKVSHREPRPSRAALRVAQREVQALRQVEALQLEPAVRAELTALQLPWGPSDHGKPPAVIGGSLDPWYDPQQNEPPYEWMPTVGMVAEYGWDSEAILAWPYESTQSIIAAYRWAARVEAGEWRADLIPTR